MDIGLREKILLLFLSLIAVLSITNIGAVLVATNKNIEEQAQEKLEVGARVFSQVFDIQSQQLFESAELLTSDYGFKAAVLDEDKDTILSVLNNHGARIDADLMMIASLDGELIASTDKQSHSENSFPFRHLLEEAEQQDGLAAVVELNKRAYQIVMVQVAAPIPLAWTVVGFEIDQALADQLNNLTNLDVAFTTSSENQDSLSTSTTDNSTSTNSKMAELQVASSDDRWQRITLGEEEFLAITLPLADTEREKIDVVLRTSLNAAFAKFSPLRIQMITISLIAVAISISLASIFARNITQPLFRLVSAAKRISSGDYSEEIEFENSKRNEIGQLATSFNVMQKGIAVRQEKILHQAFHDPLTGLGNRKSAQKQIDDCIDAQNQNDGSFALVCINLRQFKQVNDTFGYEIGDELLKALGQKLLGLSSEQFKPARIGPDEFLVQLDDITLNTSSEKVSELLNRINGHYDIGEVSVPLTAIAGVVLFPDHGDKTESLLRRADIALNEAKQKKNELAIYEQGSEEKYLGQIHIVNELKTAIATDQLTVFYQPKLDLHKKAITQVESLVRWFHPELGTIHPGDFIPLAEQSGLMPTLSRWILKRVIQDAAKWRDEGANMTAAVNLSAHDLGDDTLPDFVLSFLNENGLSATDLIIEVTESAVMEDPEQAKKVLDRFKQCGVKLAVDDYGTGYSSLSQLKSLPIDELKIDMAFVLSLDKNEDDQTIVHSTIEMGHNLGLSVVAEGVDNRTSWAILEQYGCDKLQGFYISKPLPLTEFMSWYKNYNVEDEYANTTPIPITALARGRKIF